jgi:iron complex outermembrane receptor protein
MSKKALGFGCSLVAVLAAGMSPAAAQQQQTAAAAQPEEIVVTAEKRSERLRDIPVSISAYGGEGLEAAGVEGIRGLQTQAPSLQAGASGAETYLSIRGVGSEIISIGAEPGVTVSQDGVVFARHLLFDQQFLDVARIEVLRGPQGTISGRNATGGAINVISNRPTREFEAGLAATVGNYSRFSTEGYVSGPLSGDRVLGRFAFATDYAHGWLKNTDIDERLGGQDRYRGRASLLFNLSDSFEALATFDALLDNSTPQRTINIGRARPDRPSLGEVFNVTELDLDELTYATTFPRDYRREQYGASLRLTKDLGDSAQLVSISGYWDSDIRDENDADGTNASLGEFPTFDYKIWQLTQELTLTADLSDRLDLILGGLYLKESAKQPLEFIATALMIGPGLYTAIPDQDLESWSGYTQLRYKLTDKLRASIGARYTHDAKQYTQTGFIFAPVSGGGKASWDALTPRFAIDYQPSDDVMLFANVSRGFKAGGFNTLNVNPVNKFNPEYVWSYEVGAKTSFLDDRANINFSAFYMDYKDLQQQIFRPANGIVVSAVENAAKARIKGFELETSFRPMQGLRLSAAVTHLDTRLSGVSTIDPVHPERGLQDLSGNRLARSPRWQVVLGGEYSVPISETTELSLRADYSYRTKQFFDFYNRPLIAQDGYGLLNLAATLDINDRWSITAFGRNVTDKRYRANALSSVLIPDVPLNLVAVGEPRMYGIKVGVKF